MWPFFRRVKVTITVPIPEAERVPKELVPHHRSWSVSVTVPWDMQVSAVFIAGIYEDLMTWVQDKPKQQGG